MLPVSAEEAAREKARAAESRAVEHVAELGPGQTTAARASAALTAKPRNKRTRAQRSAAADAKVTPERPVSRGRRSSKRVRSS